MQYNIQQIVKKYFLFFFSLLTVAIGNAVAIRANFGVSTFSCPTYILSLIPGTQFSFGTYVIFMHLIFIAIQTIINKNNAIKNQLLQIPAVLIFGFFIDFAMSITQNFQYNNNSTLYFFIRLAQLFLGNTLIALGIALEIKSNVFIITSEGFTTNLSRFLKIDFGKVKILFDSILIIVTIIFSYMYFNYWRFDVVGGGTIFSMLFIGFAARMFSKNTKFVDKVFNIKKYNINNKIYTEEKKLPVVITIARMCGSGGQEVGKMVAEKLNIKFLDQEIINQTAQKLGYTPEYVEQNEQNISNAKLFEYTIIGHGLPDEMQSVKNNDIFEEESRIINQAASESCVIIGRLADYVLKNRPCCLNVFVRSDEDFAVANICKRLNINNEEEARQRIRDINRSRANHYYKYTGKHWTSPKNYDLIINTSKLGIKTAADIICNAVEILLPTNNSQNQDIQI